MPDVEETLAEREKQYGSFQSKALTIQQIKETMRNVRGWENLDDDMRESLEMIATKIGRILYGDPNHFDSWHDIAGYAKLVADRISGDNHGRS